MSKKYENFTLAQIPELIRTIAIIPETMSIESLFRSMQVKKVHMAIVVDEYGQTAGLITLEDILEEIVGNILDEYDENNEFIQQQVDQSILIDGLTPIKAGPWIITYHSHLALIHFTEFLFDITS